MKTVFRYVHHFLRTLIISVFAITLPASSVAQTLSKTAGESAIELATLIQANELFLEASKVGDSTSTLELDESERLVNLRNDFERNVWSADKATLRKIAADHLQLAHQVGGKQDIEVSSVLATFVESYGEEFSEQSYADVRHALEIHFESSDWFTRHRAYNLVSLSYSGKESLSLALETAQAGLKTIPQTANAYVDEARLSSVSNLAYLHAMLLDLEHSVASYAEQVELERGSGKPVDGITIINNLIYAFNSWHDSATTKDLLEILLNVEKIYASRVPGLTEMRAAQTYAELGEYDKTLLYAQSALAVTKMERLREAAHLSETIALAGLGRTAEARIALERIREEVPQSRLETPSYSMKLFKIEALLSAADGDVPSALAFMERKSNANIKKILKNNNNQTSSLLASLQNSKGRQDERATALKREAELKQIALARQQRITQLLVILTIVLFVIVIAAVTFARYRSKVATRMEIAANKAVAGEKAKAEFLAIMSHELRTPLNGIMGMADILARKADTPEMKQKTGIILDCSQDLLGLVENIFDMTLIESGGVHLYPERINVHKLISAEIDKWRPIIEAKGVIFTAHMGAGVPEYMEADRARLIKPFQELLSNAAKFTQKGRIHIHISANLAETSGRTELKVIVADTGVGISDEAQTRLFKPFVQADSSMTRHFGGAGLGLAIARGLAQMMDGDITVNSRNGRGSEFTLTLNAPALIAPAQNVANNKVSTSRAIESKRPSTAEQSLALPSARILIAEDDMACQNLLRSLLEPTGARVICTINGQEALEALSLNRFDLVITDIRMPGMDGVTTARRIRNSRQEHRDIPIIALSADVAAETNARCKAAGIDLFLTKPVKAGDLFAAIKQVKNKRQPLPSAAQVIAS